MANDKRIDNYSYQCGRLNPAKKGFGGNYLTRFSHFAGWQFAASARNPPKLPLLREAATASGLAVKPNCAVVGGARIHVRTDLEGGRRTVQRRAHRAGETLAAAVAINAPPTGRESAGLLSLALITHAFVIGVQHGLDDLLRGGKQRRIDHHFRAVDRERLVLRIGGQFRRACHRIGVAFSIAP